jgi:hypothetical protein
LNRILRFAPDLCRLFGLTSLHLIVQCTLTFLIPCPLVADEPISEAKTRALKSLQGEWIQQCALLDGRLFEPERRLMEDGRVLELKTTLRIGDNKYVWQFPEGRPSFGSKVDFEFDLNAASEPWVIRETRLGSQFPDHAKRAMIIRITGEKLEMCYHLDSGKREIPPTTFDGTKGTGQALITLKRVKASEADKEKKKG